MLLPHALAKGTQALLDSDTSVGKALRFGIDQPTENFATTLRAMGFKDAENFMRELIDAPENYESAAGKFINEQNKEHWGDYEWQYFPRFVLEQAGQLAGSLITRAGGASAGMAIGGPPAALALGLLGPALFEAVQVAGPIAMDHAKRRAPVGVEKEPTWEDWKFAIPGTAFSGVLNAIGVFNIGKLNSTILGSGLREGVTETGQGLTEQIFGSLGTPGGVEIDTHAAVAEGLAGAGTGVAAQTPVSVAGMLKTPTPTDAITEMAETVNPPLVTETITEEPPTPTEAEEPPAVSPEDFRPAFTDEEIAAGDVPLLTQVPEEITTETFFALPADIRAKYTGRTPFRMMEDKVSPQVQFERDARTWQNYLIGAGKTPISRQEMGQLLGRKLKDDFVTNLKSDFNERVDEYVQKGYSTSTEHLFSRKKLSKSDDEYGKLPETDYTRSPEFKQDLAEYIIKQKLGLTRDRGRVERPTAWAKWEKKGEKPGRYDQTIIEGAQNLLFEKAVDNFYKPLMLNTIESLEAETSAQSDFISTHINQLTPQQKENLINLLTGRLYDKSVFESGTGTDYLTSWPTIFEKPSKAEEKVVEDLLSPTAADMINNIETPEGDVPQVSTSWTLSLIEKIQTNIVDDLKSIENETFKQRIEKEGKFEKLAEQLDNPSLFTNLTDREKARIKTDFIKEVSDHPEYRYSIRDVSELTDEELNFDIMVGNIKEDTAKEYILGQIRNLNMRKEASKMSKGLPQDVINRFSGHNRLNTFEDLLVPAGYSQDAVGPLTPRVFTVAELAQGKSGPIDPNFLSYSVLRKQLDKLQSEGLVSLPANEMLSYLTEPYSKLDSELKGRVPQFSDPTPKAMASTGGFKRPGAATRLQEAKDMQILPFLEAIGKEEVDIEYLKALITQHLSGFDIHVARDWVEGDPSVHTYSVIPGPKLGRFDIVTQHLPLLSPSEQALVNKQRTSEGESNLTTGEYDQLKAIFETSPDVYTERDSMHNWVRHPVSGIEGMGTVMWIRGTRRQALPKKKSRFKDQEVIGWMPDESQSYWIQKTRHAIELGKKHKTAPSKTFRYDYAKERQEQLEMNQQQRLDLDELIMDEATLREPAREELKNYLINTPIDKTKQFPEGYWKSYLTRSDTGGRALDNLFRDINRLYRGRTSVGEYLTNEPVTKYNKGVQTFLQRDPAYKEKFKKLDERETELEDTFYEELLIEEQPFAGLGKRIDDQTLAEIKEIQVYETMPSDFWEQVNSWTRSQGWDTHSTDPERADEKAVGEVLVDLKSRASKQAQMVLDQELVEAQLKAVDKITKQLPDFSEYVETISQLPSPEDVRAYERSLEQGERNIMPDPPFRESFNRMNLRQIVVQSLKNGEKFIIIPGSKTGTGRKAKYDLDVQKKYGQTGAPEGNYKQMLNEGHEIAEEFGLVLEVMELDVGDGNKADVTVINIEPLYSENLIPEEGHQGYKHGGLVTKSQGAGYNMNYGEYGRSYN